MGWRHFTLFYMGWAIPFGNYNLVMASPSPILKSVSYLFGSITVSVIVKVVVYLSLSVIMSVRQ